MSFASHKFLPTGRYIIINAKHDLSIACREEDRVGFVKSTTDENIQVHKTPGIQIFLSSRDPGPLY